MVCKKKLYYNNRGKCSYKRNVLIFTFFECICTWSVAYNYSPEYPHRIHNTIYSHKYNKPIIIHRPTSFFMSNSYKSIFSRVQMSILLFSLLLYYDCVFHCVCLFLVYWPNAPRYPHYTQKLVDTVSTQMDSRW